MKPVILEFRGTFAKLLLLTGTLLPSLSIPTAEFELSHGLRFDSLSAENTHEVGKPRPQPPTVNCFARCIAICASGSDVEELKQCEGDCHKYSQIELCKDAHHKIVPECWPQCRNLGFPSAEDLNFLREMGIPKNFSVAYNSDFKIDARWEAMHGAIAYLVEIEGENVADNLHLSTRRNSFLNLTMSPDDYICGSLELKLGAANKVGLTRAAKFTLEKPKPLISAKMKLISMVLDKEPFIAEDYKSNNTVVIELEFDLKKWPFGREDLEVSPLFHMISCDVANLEVAVPAPEFKPGERPNSLIARVGSDLMHRRCRFIYAVNEVRSKKCGTAYQISASNDEYSSVVIECDTVKNSNCQKPVDSAPPPACGAIKKFKYEVRRLGNDLDANNISVRITFESAVSKKPSYFIAIYGHANEFSTQEAHAFLGVNMTDVLGNATNCEQYGEHGWCKRTKESIVIEKIEQNKLYGVTICAIFDPANLSLPMIGGPHQKFMANKIFVVADSEQVGPGVAMFATILTVFVLILAVLAIVFWIRTQKNAGFKKRVHLEALRQGHFQDDRYVELPKKADSWELERRNLIIWDDKKLGSGAFGAVFLGKMVGLTKGRERNGQLNVTLMRLNSENSLVAVKMLPEYADDVSKSEFLREISLMKTLGFHERLVNMLACITSTEPYCLIVEMCNDGDLLHFLRERCKYMLDLSESKINYEDPLCDADFDRDMIMSLKQLLVFMVQISYGLEYLAQKGFVHRDVAARNIMVHDKRYAKIGDFGLCRYIYAESCNYKGRGGRLPVKWMSPEAIRFYEFTSSSDVWSFGVLMFEVLTLGGTPYPGIQPDDMLSFLEAGQRINKPDNCPEELYKIMSSCWHFDSRRRPEFSSIRQQLALQLEELADEYSYLKLDATKDYYNVSYKERREQEVGSAGAATP